MLQLYCSTGVFVGRLNNRNHRLIGLYGDMIECDGFELMLYDSWHDSGKEIIKELAATRLCFPVVHADKRTGDMLGNPDADERFLFELWRENCAAACDIGAEKIVVHPWGVPYSDKNIGLITEQLGKMHEIARSCSIDMLAENCLCLHGTPIEQLEQLARDIPDMGFILDTRSAQFHSQLIRTAQSSLVAQGRVRHIHAIDYAGGHMDFEHRYPIPDPGCGNVDFNAFFAALAQSGYCGSITLEASMHSADGINPTRINSALRLIRSAASVLS